MVCPLCQVGGGATRCCIMISTFLLAICLNQTPSNAFVPRGIEKRAPLPSIAFNNASQVPALLLAAMLCPFNLSMFVCCQCCDTLAKLLHDAASHEPPGSLLVLFITRALFDFVLRSCKGDRESRRWYAV